MPRVDGRDVETWIRHSADGLDAKGSFEISDSPVPGYKDLAHGRS